ncbi:hypothetical protein [Methanothrix sp.]
MSLKGWRTYIAAALVFVTGLLEFVDEVAAADYIGGISAWKDLSS